MARIRLSNDVFNEAINRMVVLYENPDNRPVISFSAGKDSGVLVEICILAADIAGRLPVEVLMRDEEIMLPGTYEYAERMAARPEVKFYWLVANQPILNIYNREVPYFWVFDPDLPPEAWVRQPPKNAIFIDEQNIEHMTNLKRFPPFGPDGRLFDVLGLRASESAKRAMGIHSTAGYLTKGPRASGSWGCRPIYDWSDGDIWLANKRFCNPGEAPIWMGDFSFKRLDEVQVGDEVIGWAEGRQLREWVHDADPDRRPRPRKTDRAFRRTMDDAKVLTGDRRLVRATVEKVHVYEDAELVEIVLESGRTLRCTPDHIWRLSSVHGATYYGPARVGQYMTQVVEPGSNGYDDRVAGWLGGIYDGEASKDRIYQSPEHNPDVYAEIGRALEAIGVPASRLSDASSAQYGYRITGGRSSFARFLSVAQPTRRGWLEGAILHSRIGSPDRILDIRPAGSATVFGLTTTSGNYVAWGMASRNSWDYNHAYDVMHKLGIPRNLLRIAPPTMSPAGIKVLQLASKAWPDWFGKVCERLPGVRQGAQFGLRAIQPQRRVGETWQQCYQRECIDDAPAWIAERATKAREVFLRRHARHSTAPYPEIVPCPGCGGGMGNWWTQTVRLYSGDPFSSTANYLPYIEPEVFKPSLVGTKRGLWGGRPSF